MIAQMKPSRFILAQTMIERSLLKILISRVMSKKRRNFLAVFPRQN
jgi:hypothetical protein